MFHVLTQFSPDSPAGYYRPFYTLNLALELFELECETCFRVWLVGPTDIVLAQGGLS